MKNITQQYRDLSKEINDLEGEIKDSDVYSDFLDQLEGLNDQRTAIQLKMNKMLVPLEEKQAEFTLLKKEIISSGEIDSSFAKFKYKNKNIVSVARFYDLVEDVDIVLSLATITQTALKDYAKTNPSIEEDVMDCVELASQTIDGIELVETD